MVIQNEPRYRSRESKSSSDEGFLDGVLNELKTRR